MQTGCFDRLISAGFFAILICLNYFEVCTVKNFISARQNKAELA